MAAAERMSTRETAEYIGADLTSEATLRWWRHIGHGGPPSYRIGRRVVYDRKDVDTWLAEAKANDHRLGA